jgi:hypothetical protein
MREVHMAASPPLKLISSLPASNLRGFIIPVPAGGSTYPAGACHFQCVGKITGRIFCCPGSIS